MKKYSQLIRHEGNIPLFKMIELAITGVMNDIPVHIHAEGLRGTGKTTIIRATKEILPKIERIKGCIYNCDPNKPHCPKHSKLSKTEIKSIGTEVIQIPFLEISPSAKKGTIVGSIDLKKLTSKKSPTTSLLLGTIPKAHRGIVFVDEINRVTDVAPEIADILLDVMGTKPGRIQIEESGLPVIDMPIQVSVWAASNPDEDPGPLEDIRKQLSDRFDFCIDVKRPKKASTVRKILENDSTDCSKNVTVNKLNQLSRSTDDLNIYRPRKDILQLLSSLYIDFGLESLRTVESIVLGLKLQGALTKRTPNFDDLLFISKWALYHRTDNKNLNKILTNLKDIKMKELNIKSKTEIKQKQKYKMTNNKRVNPREKCFKENNLFERISYFFNKLFGKNNKKKQKKAIKAPPERAQPLSRLCPDEYVKTEEEL